MYLDGFVLEARSIVLGSGMIEFNSICSGWALSVPRMESCPSLFQALCSLSTHTQPLLT